MKKEEVQKIVLVLIIAFGICYSYYTYLFVPEWDVIKTSTARLNERESYYQRLKTYAANASQIEKEMTQLKSQETELLSQTSAKLNKPDILVYLYNLAKQSQVIPDKVVFGNPINKGTYQELPLTFTFSGQVDVVLNLIHSLQYQGNQRFSVHETKLSAQEGVLKGELKLVVYSPILAKNGAKAGTKPPYMVYPFGTATPAQIFSE